MRHSLPILLLLLAGCSSTATAPTKELASGPAPLVDFKPSTAFTVRWHRNVGDLGTAMDYSRTPIGNPADVRWRMKADYGDMGYSALQPALTQDAIFAANSEGKIVRLDRHNGRQVWRIDSGFVITAGVGLGNGLVLVGGEKGQVSAYGEDGVLRWQSNVSSEVLGTPQLADGIVVVRSGDGRIAGLNAEDGKRRWLYERTMPALVVRSSAGVLIRQETIFAGYAGGRLAALNLSNGNVKWEAALSEPRGNTELERISDITSQPQSDDTAVCAVSFQGRIGCFDAAQGNLLWSKDLSSDKGMAMQNASLYVADAQGAILALDKSSGRSVWKNDQLFMRRTAAPALLGDYVVTGDYQGYLYAMKREDGSLAARSATDGSPIVSAPIEMDGGLLVETYDGGLYSVMLH
jgi:outer membrane protein assembly factor BamB